jgi:hypothetical protein
MGHHLAPRSLPHGDIGRGGRQAAKERGGRQAGREGISGECPSRARAAIPLGERSLGEGPTVRASYHVALFVLVLGVRLATKLAAGISVTVRAVLRTPRKGVSQRSPVSVANCAAASPSRSPEGFKPRVDTVWGFCFVPPDSCVGYIRSRKSHRVALAIGAPPVAFLAAAGRYSGPVRSRHISMCPKDDLRTLQKRLLGAVAAKRHLRPGRSAAGVVRAVDNVDGVLQPEEPVPLIGQMSKIYVLQAFLRRERFQETVDQETLANQTRRALFGKSST